MSQLPTSHSRSGGHQGPETFLAPSADKQTGEGDINRAIGVLMESPKCSNCDQRALHCATVSASE